MQFITYLIIPVVVWLVIASMNKEARKGEKDMDEYSFSVSQPKAAVIVGAVDAVLFSAFMVLMMVFPNDTDEWWVYLCFAFFIIFGLLLAVYGAFWELRIENDTISFSPVFGKKKTFTFDDISNIKIKETSQYQQIIAYSGKKRLFAVESNCKGYTVLAARLLKENVSCEMA